MAPYSFTIFTKKNMIKNVLPFFLNGGVQDVTSGSSNVEWNGSSSFVNISASEARTISFGVADPSGRPVKPGTMVVVMKTDNNANAITVDPSPDMEAAADTFVLDVQNQTCLLMFKAPHGSNTRGEWVMLASDTSSSFDGGTVNSATIFLSSVGITGDLLVDTNLFVVDSINDKIGFFGATAVVQQTGAEQLSDSTGGTAAADNTLVAVTTTTSDVSALINNNFATLAREVEALRAKLASYGLLG